MHGADVRFLVASAASCNQPQDKGEDIKLENE